MSKIETEIDLFYALKKIYELAIAENKARVARGEEWLQNFGECGFYFWDEFWEVESHECYTIKHGTIEEYALSTYVCVTREKGEDGEEGGMLTVMKQTQDNFQEIDITVQELLDALESREGNTEESDTEKNPEIITERFSSMKRHVEKARKLADFLIEDTTLTNDDILNSVYFTDFGSWYLNEPRKMVKLLKNPHPKLTEKMSCEIAFGDGDGFFASLTVTGVRVKKEAGDFEALLKKLDETEFEE